MRSTPQHDWPELKNAPSTRFSTVASSVGVGAHVGGVLAAELEAGGDEALAAARCTAWPPPTEPVKATKAMRASPITRADLLVVEVQELEHAVGQAGGLERLGVALGDERRLLRHLEDHAVAGEQRGHDRVHRGEPGIVPRRETSTTPSGSRRMKRRKLSLGSTAMSASAASAMSAM